MNVVKRCLNIEYFRESPQKANTKAVKVLLDEKIGCVLLNFCKVMCYSRQLKQKKLSDGGFWQLLGNTGSIC